MDFYRNDVKMAYNVPSIAVRCGFRITNFQKQIKDE